jgi:hypothetical protein
MKKLFTLFILFIPFITFAQLNDNFESGNIDNWTESPANSWEASTVNPLNGNYSLHHKTNETIAVNYHNQISTTFGSWNITSQTTTWRFQVKYEYEPSGDNTWSVFLLSDTDASQMFPTGTVNGYTFGVNFSGTSDLIQLWKVTNGTASAIINTNYNWQSLIGKTKAAGLEIKRTSTGEWSIFIDDDGGFDNLVPIGTPTIDATFTTATYFGICHEFTSSADQLLWFDDIYIGSEILDTNPPIITNITANANNTITVDFNEKVTQATAETLLNYIVNNSLGNPISAVFNTTTSRQVELTFSTTFTNDLENTLTANGISDLNSNLCVDATGTFTFTNIQAVSTIAVTKNQLDIYFNKLVDATTAQTITNYTVDNGINNPTTATVDGTNGMLVHLTFSSDFISETQYSVNIINIKDQTNNTMEETNLPFTFIIPKAFDIIFNEIMCDINPLPNGLPGNIYIELYNTSDYDIDMTGWKFQSENQTAKVFPSTILNSGEYLILCQSANVSFFTPYGNVAGIISSTDLTTTGRRIQLKTPDGIIIEDVLYSNTWYDDELKEDGGWSLERIDPLNFCSENENWTASKDISGGTPGKVNSQKGTYIDITLPEILSVQEINSNTIIVTFNKNISYETVYDVLNYNVNNSIGNPSLITINPSDHKILTLNFATQFTDKTIYTITIDNLKDNCGNLIETVATEFTYNLIFPVEIWGTDKNVVKLIFNETVDFTSGTTLTNYSADNSLGNPEQVVRDNTYPNIIYLQFTNNFPEGETVTLSISNVKDVNQNNIVPVDMQFMYYIPQTNDIVINEVLFNPFTGGSDFVEIYNRSEKVIDISKIRLANKDAELNVTDLVELTYANKNINPGEYQAFTLDKENIILNYFTIDTSKVFELSSMPSYSDDAGNVVITTKDTLIIDEFFYIENMHLSLLSSVEGVSLERVNYDKETGDLSNWHSASSSCGFATPGLQNSQFNDIMSSEVNQFTLLPKIFSPDNDGLDDYVNLSYTFDSPGYIANIYIFDANGRVIKRLANNATLNLNGTLFWDGTKDDNTKATSGIYLFYVEVYNEHGTVSIYKEVVTLATRF